MLSYCEAGKRLAAAGLEALAADIEDRYQQRLAPAAHGDWPKWQAAVEALADADIGSDTARAALLALCPWRKGPLTIRGVDIDAEWRSDLKWNRVRSALADLTGNKVLEVGCGKG